MKEQTVLRIAIITALTGIFLLLVILKFDNAGYDLKESLTGRIVSISYGKNTRISLLYNSTVDVIVQENLSDVRMGDEIKVIGSISDGVIFPDALIRK